MRKHEADFDRAGATLVAIGQGRGEAATRFCAKLQVGYPCLGDVERKSFEAFEFPRGSWSEVTWEPLLRDPRKGIPRIFQADLEGARAEGSDVKQLGGVAVVDPTGRVRFRYRQKTSADLVAPEELLRAVASIR